MLYFAEEKAKKLGVPGFVSYADNWLLIYDNWPVPALDDERATSYLAAKLAETSLPFDRIYVECSTRIAEFVGSKLTLYRINDLWHDS